MIFLVFVAAAGVAIAAVTWLIYFAIRPGRETITGLWSQVLIVDGLLLAQRLSSTHPGW
ncbi:MAG: hypothetical protein AABM43_06105 [Actinomycetota bacterium]